MLRKTIASIILFLILTATALFAQITTADRPLLMTYDENAAWLVTLKPLDKASQWAMITERYFRKREPTISNDSARFYALLVVDGVPLAVEDLNGRMQTKLTVLLMEDKIAEIAIIDKEPEGMYINKVFTGLILITLNDKRTSKKLRKLMQS